VIAMGLRRCVRGGSIGPRANVARALIRLRPGLCYFDEAYFDRERAEVGFEGDADWHRAGWERDGVVLSGDDAGEADAHVQLFEPRLGASGNHVGEFADGVDDVGR
jgi:hypothetical protein